MKLLDKEGLTYYTSKVKGQLATKQPLINNDHKLSASLVSGLSSVATSGSYNDLSGTPDLSVYLNKSSVVNASSTTAGETYDVRYINSMIGNLETILTTLDIGGGAN